MLKVLPCKLEFMVYFLKRHLRVYFKNNDTQISYVALGAFNNNSRIAFENETTRLRLIFEKQPIKVETLSQKLAKRVSAMSAIAELKQHKQTML